MRHSRKALAAVAALSATGCAELFGVDAWPETGSASVAQGTGGQSAETVGGGGGLAPGGAGGRGGAEVGPGGAGGGATPGSAVRLVDEAYVDLQPTTLAVPATGFTWELWFKGYELPTNAGNGRAQILLGAMDSTACEEVHLGFGTPDSPQREISFKLDGDGGCAAENTVPLHYAPPAGFENDVWYHVAVVVDYASDLATLYLDAAPVDQKRPAVDPLTQPMNFNAGRFFDGTIAGFHFQGAIDDIRVYSAPLSAARIDEHYNLGNGAAGEPDEPDLSLGWRFDEGSGSLAFNYVTGAVPMAVLEGAQWTTGIVPAP